MSGPRLGSVNLADSVTVARSEYAAAAADALDLPVSTVLALMDRELDDLKNRRPSPSDERWYASIERGQPDYGIYDDPTYMLYLWPGTVLYARPTLRWISQHVPAARVRTVIDVGCGIGYSTACLAAAYPDAAVYGTNVEGVQAKAARSLGRRHGFTLRPDVASIEVTDPSSTLIVASEYFEHFHAPIAHLRTILSSVVPHWFAIANAFGAVSAGHFPQYLDGSTHYTPRQIGRRFNDHLRQHGYTKTGSGWNGRPSLWTQKD